MGLRLEAELVDPRKRASSLVVARYQDPVHAAMGEFEAGHLRPLGHRIAIDEPYQHYQFAGRADLVAWDAEARAMLHLENRTRLPNIQDMAGPFNSKRAYLGQIMAERTGVRGWTSETHVIMALWSAEVLHALRLRTESFRSICPDSSEPFGAWWAGRPPASGRASTLVVVDPLAAGRQRQFVGLDDALTARPRYSGYAHAAEAIARAA
jgi:hypothetical protein